jgi:hypothetical protein
MIATPVVQARMARRKDSESKVIDGSPFHFHHTEAGEQSQDKNLGLSV